MATDTTSQVPSVVHRRAVALLRSLGCVVEEEAPSATGPESRKGRIEGAVQGERNLVPDTKQGGSARRTALALILASLVLFAISGYGISQDSADLGSLFVIGLFLAIFGYAFYPRRRFQSDMVWIGYEAPEPHGPTTVNVRAAHVWSGNSPRPSKHAITRELFQLADRPELHQFRDRVSRGIRDGGTLPADGDPLPG